MKRETKIIERVVGDQIDLSQAPVLIAGGRGVDGNFRMMQELADILGGEVGATRPPVDEGHIDRERQIGQTGIVCSPNVAICCGISGAFHFIVGIEKAETVIAINSDTGAPIFDHADYCVIEDVNKIIPKLLDETIRKVYAYRGDQPGVAHGLVGTSKVTVDEAEFVLAMSAAIIIYLVKKGK